MLFRAWQSQATLATLDSSASESCLLQKTKLKRAQTVTELQNSLELVKSNLHQLIRSEIMTALGGLMAGVAHEINMPVGIGVTAALLLEEKTSECARLFASQTMR